MAIAELIAMVRTGGTHSGSGNTAVVAYFIFALVAAVVGLVVMVFIRTSIGRSPSNERKL